MSKNNPQNSQVTDAYLRQLLQETEAQKSQHTVLQLPCGCGSIELTTPGDKWITCNKCNKNFHLVWSMVNKKIKEI